MGYPIPSISSKFPLLPQLRYGPRYISPTWRSRQRRNLLPSGGTTIPTSYRGSSTRRRSETNNTRIVSYVVLLLILVIFATCNAFRSLDILFITQAKTDALDLDGRRGIVIVRVGYGLARLLGNSLGRRTVDIGSVFDGRWHAEVGVERSAQTQG